MNEQQDIRELPNNKHAKRKSVLPAIDLDQFLKKQRTRLGDEMKYDNSTTNDVEFMYAPPIDERNKGLDDLVDQEEIGEDGCSIDEKIDIDCSTKGTIARNPRFISLMYTSWHGVPKVNKMRMWEYVNAISEMNSQNRKKQKWRHQMRPINFGRIRMTLHATKKNNEEPSKSEMFIATRTKKGKEVQADTQVAIAELENRQNARE